MALVPAVHQRVRIVLQGHALMVLQHLRDPRDVQYGHTPAMLHLAANGPYGEPSGGSVQPPGVWQLLRVRESCVGVR